MGVCVCGVSAGGGLLAVITIALSSNTKHLPGTATARLGCAEEASPTLHTTVSFRCDTNRCHDALDGGVVLQCVLALLAAPAGLLGAAERAGHIEVVCAHTHTHSEYKSFIWAHTTSKF